MDMFNAISDDPRDLRGKDYIVNRLSRKTSSEYHKFLNKYKRQKRNTLTKYENAAQKLIDMESENTINDIRSKFVKVRSHQDWIEEEEKPFPCKLYYTKEEEALLKE